MKKILLICVLLASFSSCKKDDDDSIDTVDGLIPLELNKNFLLDEKWFFESATSDIPYDLNGDGTKTTELNSQILACDLDSYYVFEANQPDIVVLREGENVCADNFEVYNTTSDFEVFKERKVLEIDTAGLNLLGRFLNVIFLDELEFLQSRDSSFKLIRCEIRVVDEDNNVVNVSYTLKSTIDNRPE